jgi:hypothetical protein
MGFLSKIGNVLGGALPAIGTAVGSFFGPSGAAVGGAVGGALGSAVAGKSANDSATRANRATLNAQEKIYNQGREDFLPYMNIGLSAKPEYMRMLGLNEDGSRMTDVADAPTLSPLAQWQQQEFNKSQNRQDAARGLAGSGGASARMAEGASAIAGQDYMNSYSRILDALKIGTGASGSAGSYGSQYSNQIGQAGANSMKLKLAQGDTNSQLWQGLGGIPADYLTYKNMMGTSGGSTTAPMTYGGSSYVPGGSTSFDDKQLGLM